MKKLLCKWLFHLLGWTYVVTVPDYKKCILCVAPHTSNWDFFYGKLYYTMLGKQAMFLMKKEMFVWPLGWFFRRMGGIPVDRSHKTHLTDRLASLAKRSEHFRLTITPEGTRSLNPDWKVGFYYIALKAGVPILLYGLDYKKKQVVCTQALFPSGNLEEDMDKIKHYFEHFGAKHPAQFTVGKFHNK